jgi:hypothetical protein
MALTRQDEENYGPEFLDLTRRAAYCRFWRYYREEGRVAVPARSYRNEDRIPVWRSGPGSTSEKSGQS